MAFLAGVRVVDFSRQGPGARASRVLADYGAEVVKVARPAHRMVGEIETPDTAYGGGAGTTRVAIDLQTADGRDLAVRLAARADVVIDAFRPGVADRLGIGYDDVRARNPRVVYCAISGYGRTGPRAGWVGHDLNYVAVSGLLDRTQRPSGDMPPVLGATIGDGAGGGLHAVVAVLAALLARERTGEGAFLDVATADGVLWLMAVQLEQHLGAGLDHGPVRLLSGDFACYRSYRCGDGRWLSVAALEHRFWRNLCVALGVVELVDAQETEARQPELIAVLDAVFATRSRDEWMGELGPLDTCIAPVLGIEEVVHDEQVLARGHLRAGTLGPLLAGARRDAGSGTIDVLAELGIDAAAHARLVGAGVLGEERR